jgi:UDP-N-acetyl-D-mannosaminuronate dehydrogenase
MKRYTRYVGGTDPYIPRPPKMRKFKLEKGSVALTADILKKYDCVVIATDHADYAPEFILENSRICDYLIEKGHEVVCVDELVTKGFRLAKNEYTSFCC